MWGAAGVHNIDIHFEPQGKNGSGYLTASQDGQPIEFGTVNLANAKARADFAKRVVKKCPGQDADEIEAHLMKLGADQIASKSEPIDDEPPDDDPGVLLSAMPAVVKQQARAMLDDPTLMDRIGDDLGVLVAGERKLAQTLYMVGTSRQLTKPLNCIVQGQSSTGKSHTIAQVASVFPPEAVVVATQFTPQALFHMEPGSLMHRFVVAGERSRIQNDDRAEATRALREMQSEGRLIKLMPCKIDGEIRTVPIRQEGPIAFCESTTLNNVFGEDANRCIMAVTDERAEQTRSILEKIGADFEGQTPPGEADAVRQRHHAIQRMLKPLTIVIPYASKLASMIAAERVEARRAGPQLFSMIQASALLHQYQRQVDEHGRLIADFQDYIVAHHLLAGPLSRSLGGGLSDAATRFHGRLVGYVHEGQTFTSRQIVNAERGTASKSGVYGWLSELHEVGLLEVAEAGKGPRPVTWKMTGLDPQDAGDSPLPTPAELGAVI